MSQNRNRTIRDFSLTYDQRLLLDLYIDFYNHTSQQIDSLYELQNEIRGNINQIVGLTNNYNYTEQSRQSFRQTNRNSNPNIRQQNVNRRSIYFDYTPYLMQDTTSHRNHRQTQSQSQSQSQSEYSYNQEYLRLLSSVLRRFYDRVPVVPTQEQIQASTRLVRFSEIECPLNISCPVTLDRFDDNSSVTQIIPCGHIFTPSGIEAWLQSNVICPVCRYDIRNYVVSREESEPEQPVHVPLTNETTLEETKEEPEHLEESKTEDERNIPNTPPSFSTRYSEREIQNTLSSITENILGNLFSSGTGTGASSTQNRFTFDSSYNSLFFDSSNNQIIFEGYLRPT
jgi:hypothetical protein